MKRDIQTIYQYKIYIIILLIEKHNTRSKSETDFYFCHIVKKTHAVAVSQKEGDMCMHGMCSFNCNRRVHNYVLSSTVISKFQKYTNVFFIILDMHVNCSVLRPVNTHGKMHNSFKYSYSLGVLFWGIEHICSRNHSHSLINKDRIYPQVLRRPIQVPVHLFQLL